MLNVVLRYNGDSRASFDGSSSYKTKDMWKEDEKGEKKYESDYRSKVDGNLRGNCFNRGWKGY